MTLFVAAGVVLIAASFLLEPVARRHRRRETARPSPLYAAANETIAIGATTALNAVVAPYFVDPDPAPA